MAYSLRRVQMFTHGSQGHLTECGEEMRCGKKHTIIVLKAGHSLHGALFSMFCWTPNVEYCHQVLGLKVKIHM